MCISPLPPPSLPFFPLPPPHLFPHAPPPPHTQGTHVWLADNRQWIPAVVTAATAAEVTFTSPYGQVPSATHTASLLHIVLIHAVCNSTMYNSTVCNSTVCNSTVCNSTVCNSTVCNSYVHVQCLYQMY